MQYTANIRVHLEKIWKHTFSELFQDWIWKITLLEAWISFCFSFWLNIFNLQLYCFHITDNTTQKENKIHVYYELLQMECKIKIADIISL